MFFLHEQLKRVCKIARQVGHRRALEDICDDVFFANGSVSSCCLSRRRLREQPRLEPALPGTAPMSSPFAEHVFTVPIRGIAHVNHQLPHRSHHCLLFCQIIMSTTVCDHTCGVRSDKKTCAPTKKSHTCATVCSHIWWSHTDTPQCVCVG